MSVSHAPGGVPAAPKPSTGRPGLILLASLLGLFMAQLDITVVNVALPTVRDDLNASFTDLQWVANAYLLALAVFIVTAGRLGDVFGRRGVYVTGVAIFVVGSVVCSLAKDLTVPGLDHANVLHAGRVIQGLGGAFIMPLSLAMIYASFTGRMRALGVVLWGAVGGVSTAIGPLVGGILVDRFDWPSIFLINVPIGILVIVAALAAMSGRQQAQADAPKVRQPLDVAGLVTISAALLFLNLALINGEDWGWTSAGILGLFAASVVFAVLFLVVEARSRSPIMTLGWFRRPSFGGSIIAGLLLAVGMFSMMFYLSIYLQNGLRLSVMDTGLRMLPLTIIVIAGAPIGGILAARLGSRAVLTGAFVLMAIGLALYTRIDPAGGPDSWTRLVPGMLITGFCLGVIMPLASELTIAAAPPDQVGVSSSVGTMFRQIGNSIGIALMGSILAAKIADAKDDIAALARSGKPTPEAINAIQEATIAHATQNMAWFAAGVSALGALLVLIFVRTLPKPQEPVAAEPDVPVRAVGRHHVVEPAVAQYQR